MVLASDDGALSRGCGVGRGSEEQWQRDPASCVRRGQDGASAVESARASTRRDGGERGASAVEFALVAPLFIMLVFGIIAFGIVFAQKLALSNAAKEGAALWGGRRNRTCADVIAATKDASNCHGAP